jgi:ribosomal-protein-alanine N-acetyltransferase
VTLEVRASNHAAIALYRSLGFRSIGTRTAYYPDDGEDALIMWKGDPGAAGVPAEALGAI